jgi:predicted  nucleic acid-binding Zn-ribbon protein
MSDVFQLADELAELKNRKKELENELKAVNAKIAKTDEELSMKMLEEELQSFNRNGKTFYVQTKTFAAVVPDRKPELFTWLKNHGYGDMVTETVNANTLSAFVREMLSETDQLPEDLEELVNVYEKTTVGIRKSR